MTHHPSRKQFVAKLLGVVAAASVLPKAIAKSASDAGESSAMRPSGGTARRLDVRHDARAVARRDSL